MSWHLRLGNARFRIKLAKYHGRNFLACTLKLWYLEIGTNHRQSVNIFKTFIPMGACCCQELRFRQICRCCVLLNDKVYSSWYPWNSCEYRSFFDAENTFQRHDIPGKPLKLSTTLTILSLTRSSIVFRGAQVMRPECSTDNITKYRTLSVEFKLSVYDKGKQWTLNFN